MVVLTPRSKDRFESTNKPQSPKPKEHWHQRRTLRSTESHSQEDLDPPHCSLVPGSFLGLPHQSRAGGEPVRVRRAGREASANDRWNLPAASAAAPALAGSRKKSHLFSAQQMLPRISLSVASWMDPAWFSEGFRGSR